MAFDFPASPTVGQQFTPAGGPTYTWNGYAWAAGSGLAALASPFKRTVFTASSSAFQYDATTTFADIEVVGGGASGGSTSGSSGAGQAAAGGGGGSGGYCKKLITVDATVRAATKTITINGGGAATGAGGAGGGSSIYADTVNTLTANGGLPPGVAAPISSNIIVRVGGTGGSASGGDINITGSPGSAGISFGSTNTGASSAAYMGGNGAPGPWGGAGLGPGAGAASGVASTPGGAAVGYGSGGAGSIIANAAAGHSLSGAGYQGVVIITEYR